MGRLMLLAIALLLLSAMPVLAGGEPGLHLSLVGGERNEAGEVELRVPFDRELPLRAVLRNVGEAPVTAVRSSYPVFRHFGLEVHRVEGEQRVPVKAHFDLYPLKDMKAPVDEETLLQPGQAIERDLTVLLREGYGLHTLSRVGYQSTVFEKLKGDGLGAFRQPGLYEVRCSYADLKTAPLLVRIVRRWGWSNELRTELRTTRVAKGVLRGDPDQLDAAAARGGDYVPITVESTDGKVTSFRFYATADGRNPSAASLRAMLGETRVVLLTAAGGHLYLADTEEGLAVRDLDEARVAELIDRFAYLREVGTEPLPLADETASLVGGIIEGLCDGPDAQKEGLLRLEELGAAAIPAIVMRMDDRRELPEKYVSFKNRSAGAFEAVRHYSPEQVVDALAALLNQMTGEHFVLDPNDATDAQRAHAVRAWRAWAHLHE